MNTEKGMSQILVLIVAAAVLMMVGLLLITLSSNSITGALDDTTNAACASQLDTQCRTTGQEEISSDDFPAVCEENGQVLEGIDQPYSCS